jgi:hypothetical protein
MFTYSFVSEFPVSSKLVAERLHGHVLQDVLTLSSPSEGEFRGSVSEGGFSLVKVVRGRDSFNPLIEGTIEEVRPGMTRMKVRMKMHPLVLGFMVVGTAALLYPAGRGLVNLMRGGPAGPDAAGVLFIVLMWAMASGVFFLNAWSVKDLLCKIAASSTRGTGGG